MMSFLYGILHRTTRFILKYCGVKGGTLPVLPWLIIDYEWNEDGTGWRMDDYWIMYEPETVGCIAVDTTTYTDRKIGMVALGWEELATDDKIGLITHGDYPVTDDKLGLIRDEL